MASLYSNENFPKRVVEELRRLGHDVLTSYEAGKANQKIPDDQVLSYAIEQDRVVLTLNRIDFIRLHKETQGTHPGIIVCTRDDADPLGFAARIDSSLASAGNPTGQLIRIVRPSISTHMSDEDLKQRAARGNTADLAEILANVPDAPPAPGDERK
jgi:predicted nuclease of predicted toxin-antitoxin system